MEGLKGFQKKYLRGLAHSMKPVVLIGQSGLTPGVIAAVNEALETHELIKIKFNEFKEKAQKEEINGAIEAATESEMVGMIGHLAIFYRMNPDPEKRKITLPKR
jgi:RNA-binding protein